MYLTMQMMMAVKEILSARYTLQIMCLRDYWLLCVSYKIICIFYLYIA